jgi:hypothetical protein
VAEQLRVICVKRNLQDVSSWVQLLQDTKHDGTLDEAAKHVHGEHEELRGEGVSMLLLCHMPSIYYMRAVLHSCHL